MKRFGPCVMLSVLLACGQGEPPPAPSSPKPREFDKTIQFRDGTTARLKLGVTVDGVQRFVSSDEIQVDIFAKPEAPSRFFADLCTSSDDLSIELPGYPASFSGTVKYKGVSENFQEAALPPKSHPVDGRWAISATHAASATETTVISGELLMRRHGALLLAGFDGYSWDSTTYVAAAIIPERLVCTMAAALNADRSFLLWSMHGVLSADFTSAIVWASDATGSAVKVIE